MRFQWQDERSGFWSRVVRERDRVAFAPTGTYFRSRIVGAVFAVGLGYMFAGPALKAEGTVNWAIFALVVVFAIRVAVLGSRSPSRLVVVDNRFAPESAAKTSERRLYARDISRIVVRENTGRDSDDMRMAQMYLEMKDQDLAVLAYQHSFDRRDEVRLIAKEMADRWGKRVLDQISK